MAEYSTQTIPRSPGLDLSDHTDPEALYVLSYLWTRLIIGFLGIALPFVFIIGEAVSLRGGVHVRGSLSAYYHSSMRDIFVASLCVIGFFLATYRSGEPKTLDFRISLLAGVAVFGVVFFPTTRPHLLPGAPRCGTTPMPQGCSPIQQQLGEKLVAGIHFTCAAIFILSLAAICFVFASQGREHGWMKRIVQACGWTIFAAVGWAVVGGLLKKGDIGELTPLYVAEVVSVWAFGLAWLLKARDLRKSIGSPQGDRAPANNRLPEPT
jgi:hypothetical protein